MRITILTVGTRGDVQPFVALGLGLLHAGYHVRLATESDFEPLVREHGLDFAALRAEAEDGVGAAVGIIGSYLR